MRMSRKKALECLDMFLYKQCDLERTRFAYDANTVWMAVKMAYDALEEKNARRAVRSRRRGKEGD